MHRAVTVALLLAAACQFQDSPPQDASPGTGGRGAVTDAAPLAERPVLAPRDAEPPPSVVGAPGTVGCADGTREAFADLSVWPHVAGCGGAWQVQGIVGPGAVTPSCGRAAGDTAANAAGIGCAAADLCAAGWHICRSPSELARRSPTGCESAVAPQSQALYVIASGATEAGTCLADDAAPNDVHGCGTVGQPEDESCAPLDRRLGYADCLRTGGVWACGTPDDPTREAQLVTKEKAMGGGVICCRDVAP